MPCQITKTTCGSTERVPRRVVRPGASTSHPRHRSGTLCIPEARPELRIGDRLGAAIGAGAPLVLAQPPVEVVVTRSPRHRQMAGRLLVQPDRLLQRLEALEGVAEPRFTGRHVQRCVTREAGELQLLGRGRFVGEARHLSVARPGSPGVADLVQALVQRLVVGQAADR